LWHEALCTAGILSLTKNQFLCGRGNFLREAALNKMVASRAFVDEKKGEE
jgi:hypothetical protein